ncbi:hypothetical protein [Ileibacterium valens]|uniref:hypothetical protein n=1 Tax=Ileibacterium valens TaxID=1862668 RepID=UPI0015B79D32|nr:hypothetical protein [Ileibacterium valens]
MKEFWFSNNELISFFDETNNQDWVLYGIQVEILNQAGKHPDDEVFLHLAFKSI